MERVEVFNIGSKQIFGFSSGILRLKIRSTFGNSTNYVATEVFLANVFCLVRNNRCFIA